MKSTYFALIIFLLTFTSCGNNSTSTKETPVYDTETAMPDNNQGVYYSQDTIKQQELNAVKDSVKQQP